jgi:hypothetical protein
MNSDALRESTMLDIQKLNEYIETSNILFALDQETMDRLKKSADELTTSQNITQEERTTIFNNYISLVSFALDDIFREYPEAMYVKQQLINLIKRNYQIFYAKTGMVDIYNNDLSSINICKNYLIAISAANEIADYLKLKNTRR